MLALVGLVGLHCPGPARADRFTEATLDFAESERLARRLASHVFLFDAVLAVPEWADKALAPRGTGLCVLVRGPDQVLHLVASGPLVDEAASLILRLPSGEKVPVTRLRTLGDGAIAELTLPGPLTEGARLPPAPPPPPLDGGEEAEALPEYGSPAFVPRPVFAVAVEVDPPSLGRGATVDRLAPPLDLLITVSPRTHPGTAWFDVDGELLAVTIRPSPQDDELALAVRGETLREWLRPEGPPHDSDVPAAPTP